jgi:hypothetical protein
MALILKGRSKLKGSTVIGKRPYAIDGVFNPELVLDFQKNYYRTNSVAKTFPNAITHTRASTATYVDADGILQTAATNVPRVGHHVWNQQEAAPTPSSYIPTSGSTVTRSADVLTIPAANLPYGLSLWSSGLSW